MDRSSLPYYVLAYYYLDGLDNYEQEIALHKDFFLGRDATARVYVNETGINGQLCAAQADAEAYIEWMHSRDPFQHVYFKVHHWHEHVFPRFTVKYRKKLVAYDEEVDMGLTGDHVSPEKWKEMLESKDPSVLIDVRNDYEWKVGHFEGAELPPCETFRDFSTYADELKERVDEKTTPVMMYCTGGIRCELYSSILKKKGFEKVYQLDGGVINYGLKQGSDHWLGKLFVFDDRLTVSIADKPTEVIGKCYHCGASSESYYNCANMDCNHLFLCCPACLKKYVGCCCKECHSAPRIRPYHEQNPHKPFRRWYQYFAAKT